MRRLEGFTMIEVLMATAIAALLMLAVLSVTASLGQSRQVVESQTLEPSWRARMIQTMDRDFALARRVIVHEDGGLVIEGLSHFTPAPGSASGTRVRHLPTTVRYNLIETDPGGTLLIREQVDPRDTGSEKPVKTLLGMNVVDITATAFYPPPAEDLEGPEASGVPSNRAENRNLHSRDANHTAANNSDTEDEQADPIGIELVIAFGNEEIEEVRRQWELPRVDAIETH